MRVFARSSWASTFQLAVYPPVAQALKFTWGDYHDFKIHMWTVQQDTKSKRSQNARIKLVFNWDWANTRGISPLDLAWTCFVALASPQLRSFRLSNKYIAGWDVEVWRKLALTVPGLQTLAPGRSAQCVELCKALSPADAAAAADCCFPALSYLELEVPCDHPISTLDGEESLSVVLARSLAVRASIGCLTPMLVFVVSWESPPEGWSKPFKDAVPGICVRVGRRMGEGFMG